MPIVSYVVYSMFYIGWVYPIIVHWAWGHGWLFSIQYHDFAGGGLVHMAGGTAGLVATIIMGARIDRFSPSKADDFKPNNIVNSHITFPLYYIDFLCFRFPDLMVRLVRVQLRVYVWCGW